MSIRRLVSEPPAAPPAPGGRDYRPVADELIDIGASLARLIHQQALAAPATAAEATVAFDRVARCVRRTILLARKLDEPVRAAADPAAHRDAARRRIIRGVEDAIQRQDGDEDPDALHEEFLDRLDRPDLEDDIAHLSVPEIIADICRDLGLAAPRGAHPWKRRTPDDIAELCARAAAPPLNPPPIDPPPINPPPLNPPPLTPPPRFREK